MTSVIIQSDIEVLSYLEDKSKELDILNLYPHVKQIFFKYDTLLPLAPVERLFICEQQISIPRTFVLERMYDCTQWRNYADPHPPSTSLSTFPSSEHPLGVSVSLLYRHPVRVVDARWVRRPAYLTALRARAYHAAQLSAKETGWQKKKSHRRCVTFHSGTFGQLKEMKITKRLSQSVGTKCLRTMRELCGFLFHDADPLTGRKRERRGGIIAAILHA
ncbi:hypothetical protein ALC60_07441 [Trachymyrmex zeteki]|uniref:Uncharacterized protein n=1 Tax=Mycetomoellerius zeteki TaxID=64791 RepID=A0A151WZU6_9HYME|nr:hypothetical protein ALC60_07441 [Trachymyrmex zeteki]